LYSASKQFVQIIVNVLYICSRKRSFPADKNESHTPIGAIANIPIGVFKSNK